MPGRLAVNVAVWALLGGCVIASALWSYSVFNPPEVVAQRRMERERAAQERRAADEQRAFRASLLWSGWAQDHGLKMRVGVPKEVRIGEVLRFGIEIAPVPGELKADACQVRSRAWYAGVSMRVVQGGVTYDVKEWGYPDSPWSHSIPLSRPIDTDYSAKTEPVFRAQEYMLERSSGASEGPATLTATLQRSGPQGWYGNTPDLERAWEGGITTPAVEVTLRPPGVSKQVFQVPTRLEVVRRQSLEQDPGTQMVTLLYRKESAERIEIEVPTGALVRTDGWFEPKDPSANPGLPSGTFALNPDDLSSASRVQGPFEGTFKVLIRYALPDAARDEWVDAWQRTLPVSYDPATARTIPAN